MKSLHSTFDFKLLVGAFLLACSGTGDKTQPSDQSLFRKVAVEHTQIRFENRLDEKYEYFEDFPYFYNGGGVAILDVNNDDLPDIFFTGNEVGNALYLNQGNFKFQDISSSSGITEIKGWNNGVSVVDINNDGYQDIYVCRGGWRDDTRQRQNLLWVNQGDNTFLEKAAEFGIDDFGYSVQAAFFDFDNDLDLDLYVMNRPSEFYLPLSQIMINKADPPEDSRDKLFVNENGEFTERGIELGIVENFGYGLGLVTADINNDGFTDIYVANDFAENDYLYLNKNGKFQEQIKATTNHISLYSMGVDIMDMNNDGLEDVFVTEMSSADHVRSKISMPSMDVQGFNEMINEGIHAQYMHNTLHLNRGKSFFSEISQFAGVAQTDWSWSGLASDLDNDGHKDLLVTNGYRRDIFDNDVAARFYQFVQQNRSQFRTAHQLIQAKGKEIVELYRPVEIPNYLFQNQGNLTFSDVSEAWGFTEMSFSNGAALADLDNDGDLDLVINNLEKAAFLYENTLNGQRNFLRVKLTGPSTNTGGIGAKVTLHYKGKIQYQEHKLVRGYLSSQDPVVHFGLDSVSKVDTVWVDWPDGKQNVITDVSSNQVLTVDYAKSIISLKKPSNVPSLFSEHTQGKLQPTFVHHENDFDDYAIQELLPHRLSRSGPALAVSDVNQDGFEDFYVGGASGQPGALYYQKGTGFVRQEIPLFNEDQHHEDVAAQFFDLENDGDMDLYVVSGGSAFQEGSPLYQDRLYVNQGNNKFERAKLPPIYESGSCISIDDINADGYLDVFLGHKLKPWKYPQAPGSMILMNKEGKLLDRSEELFGDLRFMGMVNTATWADLEGDKRKELIVAGEWTGIKVFQWENGTFRDVSDLYFSADHTGWWNVVKSVDLDHDGDMDLLAGNLGTNYKFKASEYKPLHLYASDFDGNGSNDVFLAKPYKSGLVPVRGKECSTSQMPLLKTKFPSYASFANAQIEEVLGPNIASSTHLQAVDFRTRLFLNKDGKMEPVELPNTVQFSVVNDIIVRDFDHDGHLDILMAGNNFDVEIETTPADASTGVYLKGLGSNQFKSLEPEESGLFIPNNVRKVKFLKMGKIEALVIGINDGPVTLITAASSQK